MDLHRWLWVVQGQMGYAASKIQFDGLKELTSDRIPPPQPTSSILNPSRGFDRVLFWLYRWSRDFLMKDTLSLFMEWRAAKSPFSLHQSLVGLLSFSTSSSSIVVWRKFKEKYTLFCLSVLPSHHPIDLLESFFTVFSNVLCKKRIAVNRNWTDHCIKSDCPTYHSWSHRDSSNFVLKILSSDQYVIRTGKSLILTSVLIFQMNS